jgi:hypothetical protein
MSQLVIHIEENSIGTINGELNVLDDPFFLGIA